jgi:SAM-dependent methyltransferase
MDEHGHSETDHGDGAAAHHGHHADRGLRGTTRYLRRLPRMWRSQTNDAVVDAIAPSAGETVVDIGAGMGAAAIRAAARGAVVVAVEPTPFMRRVLTVRRLASTARRRVEIRDGSAESLPVADGVADAVWAVNVMHHWTDWHLAVDEIARVVAPGGRILLVDEDFDDPGHPEHDAVRPGHRHHFDDVDVEAVGGRLRDAGFVDVDAAVTHFAGRPSKLITARRGA